MLEGLMLAPSRIQDRK